MGFLATGHHMPAHQVTGMPASIINYHSVSARKSRHRCATLCLGENPAQAKLKCLDLRCSFEAIVKAEYGGRDHLDFAARNYTENVKREETGIAGITYERALRNLIVAMYGHYVDLFWSCKWHGQAGVQPEPRCHPACRCRLERVRGHGPYHITWREHGVGFPATGHHMPAHQVTHPQTHQLCRTRFPDLRSPLW